MRNWFVWLCLPMLIGISGCQSDTSSTSGSGRPLVICTTQMVGDLVSQIGGEFLDVHTLMGPDIDPHLFKASPSDISRMSKANLVVYSGLHLEGNLQPALEALKRTKPAFAVTEELEELHPERLIKIGDHLYDPHVWHDVAMWRDAGSFVVKKLSELYPDHASSFQSNWEAYSAKLTQLDEQTRKELSSLPVKILVTGHDAFHYFGRTYGLEVLPVQGVTTENEASVKKINELVETLVTRKIPAIFVESTLNDRNLRALVEGAAQRGHQIRIGGTLYSDATGPKGSDAESYAGMIQANVNTIKNALSPNHGS